MRKLTVAKNYDQLVAQLKRGEHLLLHVQKNRLEMFATPITNELTFKAYMKVYKEVTFYATL